jgi:hypothetical protein
MEAHADHGHHHHHEMPTEGGALTGVAVSATLHCLTGCAIGEITGLAIGTALGFSDIATIALAVGLAFLFGYTLTSLPLLRAGLALSTVIPIALASDTFSIATMEVVDNVIMVTIPGAMDARLGDLLFWGSLSVALVIAFFAAVPVNRWLIARGKGHAVVHETGIHGGPDPRLVGAIVAVAAIFGTTVLVSEAVSDDDAGHGAMDGGHAATTSDSHEEEAEMTGMDHGSAHGGAAAVDPVRGLTATGGGLTLDLETAEAPAGRPVELAFAVAGSDGPVTEFDVEHERRMHLIVVRRDLTGFQHLHPEMDRDGTWRATTTLSEPGDYRVFADFVHEGEALTLAHDLTVAGEAKAQPLPAPAARASVPGGYEVALDGAESVARTEQELAFAVTRDGAPVEVQPYLGAQGHLVALRDGDLAFLHVHPTGGDEAGEIRFMTEFPSAGDYRLFLQFRHEGEVRTAEFTRSVDG